MHVDARGPLAGPNRVGHAAKLSHRRVKGPLAAATPPSASTLRSGGDDDPINPARVRGVLLRRYLGPRQRRRRSAAGQGAQARPHRLQQPRRRLFRPGHGVLRLGRAREAGPCLRGCSVDRVFHDPVFQYSRFVDAWEPVRVHSLL